MQRLAIRLRNLQAFGFSSFQNEANYTTELKAINKVPQILTYRVMDLKGDLVAQKPNIPGEILNKMLKTMIYTEEMDHILLKAKGQGKALCHRRQDIFLHDIVWRNCNNSWLRCRT